MKKIYMTPAVQEVKIQTSQLMAGSVDGFVSTLDATGGDGSDALARDIDDFLFVDDDF